MARSNREIQRRFGARMRSIRERAAISQEKLALEAELDRTYISKIERGLGNPSLLVLARLASILQVEISELVNGL